MVAKNKTSTSLKLHPEILMKNGRKEFVVLPYEEFVRMTELVEDARDLMDLRRAMLNDQGEPGVGVAELKAMLGLNGTKRKAKKTARTPKTRGS